MQPLNTQSDNPLIYESANGVTYARYRDPSHNQLPRWVIGGNIKGWIRGTNIITPDEWVDIKDPTPDFSLIVKNKKLLDAYTKFLEEQKKYQTWKKLSEQR